MHFNAFFFSFAFPFFSVEPFQPSSIKIHYKRALHYLITFFQFHHTEAETDRLWCRFTKVPTSAPDETLALALLYSSSVLLKLPFIRGTTTRKGMTQACVMKIQVSRASSFLVRAERSRCHEAVFNRISPSLLDIFHDSIAVSHFFRYYCPLYLWLSGLLLCCEPASRWR